MSQKVNRGRTLARSQALQLLFQAEMLGVGVDEVLAGDYLLSKGPLVPYAAELARGVQAYRDRIDSALRVVSSNWKLDRMPGPDRNLLRLAVYEMRFQTADPIETAVVINEAVEVAKAYGTDESAGFVNGVLGRIAREQVLPTLQRSGCTVTADDCEAACIAALWFQIDPAREAQRAAAAEAADAYDPEAEFEAARRARIARLGEDAIFLDSDADPDASGPDREEGGR